MDASDFLLQLTIAIIGALFGALFARVLPGAKASPSGSSIKIRGNTFLGDVRIGDTTLKVSNDNRVIIGAADASTISKQVRYNTPEKDAEREENLRLQHQRKAEERRQKEREKAHQDELARIRGDKPASNTGDDWFWPKVIAAGIVVALVVTGYVLFREQVILVITWIASFALGFSISAVLYTALRRVVLRGWLTFQLLFNIVLAFGLMLSLNWLSTPAAGANQAAYQAILNAGGIDLVELVTGLLDSERRGPYATLILQVAGFFPLVLSLGFVICHAVSVFAIARYAVLVRKDPDYVASRPQRVAMKLFRGPNFPFWAAMILAALAFLLVSGYVSEFIQWVSRNNEDRIGELFTPTPTPPPVLPEPAPTVAP
ncbi:hypothetical protein [Marisediminicola antarctica]|uniref:Uncharacterized protein n=1 Tax=Marisediminicola antarctica TaxID=674079 RepID=A0A7L5AFD1_9MICO|nr:hypothetical protein [Marisediminicola antarctica]QHO69158.1 hypothetical protein BHD05_05335 [Marisediminicola antarctica]